MIAIKALFFTTALMTVYFFIVLNLVLPAVRASLVIPMSDGLECVSNCEQFDEARKTL